MKRLLLTFLALWPLVVFGATLDGGYQRTSLTTNLFSGGPSQSTNFHVPGTFYIRNLEVTNTSTFMAGALFMDNVTFQGDATYNDALLLNGGLSVSGLAAFSNNVALSGFTVRFASTRTELTNHLASLSTNFIIYLTDNITAKGSTNWAGTDIRVFNKTNFQILALSPNAGIEATNVGNVMVMSNCYNWVFDGWQLKGRRPGSAANTYGELFAGIHMSAFNGFGTFRNMRIIDHLDHGVGPINFVRGSTNCNFINNWFENIGTNGDCFAGLSADGACIIVPGADTLMSGNRGRGNHRGFEYQNNPSGMDGCPRGYRGSVVREAVFYDHIDDAMQTQGDSAELYDGLQFINNYFEWDLAKRSSTAYGLALETGQNFVATGNTFKYAVVGINIQNVFGGNMRNHLFANNHCISNHMGFSIHDFSSTFTNLNHLLVNNFIVAPEYDGIAFSGKGLTARGNKIVNPGSSTAGAVGIRVRQLDSCTDTLLELNEIYHDLNRTATTNNYGILIESGVTGTRLRLNTISGGLLGTILDNPGAGVTTGLVLDDGGLFVYGDETAPLRIGAVRESVDFKIYRENATGNLNFYGSQSGANSFLFTGVGSPNVDVVAGHLKVSTAGKTVQIKEGTNAKMGTATLSSGLATVSTTAVAANSRIQLTVWATASPVAAVGVTNVSAGTSFQIRSTSATDGNRVDWVIFDPL